MINQEAQREYKLLKKMTVTIRTKIENINK